MACAFDAIEVVAVVCEGSSLPMAALQDFEPVQIEDQRTEGYLLVVIFGILGQHKRIPKNTSSQFVCISLILIIIIAA